MEEQIACLVKIQEVDIQIDEITRQKDVFPKKIIALKSELKEITNAIESLHKTLSDNEKERRALAGQIELENERIERIEGKLPNIKTNKEYQALGKEIDNMRKEINRCEERSIALLEEEETLKVDIKEKEAKLPQVEEEINLKIAGYEREISQFDERLETFLRDKREFATHVPKQYMTTYERIKSRRDGIAVVATINEVCQGCFMNIPPQLFNLIRKSDEIHTCPQCNRILYWRDGEPS